VQKEGLRKERKVPVEDKKENDNHGIRCVKFKNDISKSKAIDFINKQIRLTVFKFPNICHSAVITKDMPTFTSTSRSV
jgi:hypothetical protein